MPQLITGMEISHEFQLGPFLGNAFFVYTKYAYPPNGAHGKRNIYANKDTEAVVKQILNYFKR